MGFEADLRNAVEDLASTEFKYRTGRVVPTSDSVGPHDLISLSESAYLYTDMVDSSSLTWRFDYDDGARILRVFLATICRVIRERGGEIRSFDGDRVMAVFLGADAADQAVDTALRITWAVNVAHDTLHRSLPPYGTRDGWRIRHRTGIDVGFAEIVRGGVRDHNDLISIGHAPNWAAKLSDFKGGGHTIITNDVWKEMSHSNTFSLKDGESRAMWVNHGTVDVGSSKLHVRSSTWYRPY